MSHAYRAVGWNRQKRIYDGVLLAGIGLYITLFVSVGLTLSPTITPETLIIRALGTCAFLLLHLVLVIGPLCRLCPRFLPLLYNRRHLGVTLFVIALAHGLFSLIQFHGFGDLNPIVSLLTSPGTYQGISDYPFQPLGFFALIILFLMAATSHDFWLVNLSAPVWKALHMMVYLAYGLLVMHLVLGVLQAERDVAYVLLLALGVGSVLALHLLAAHKEARQDRAQVLIAKAGYMKAVHVDDIENNCAKTVCFTDERIAIFKYDGKIAAVSNACRHQNGPLGEGRVIDGCITCPWHGYQYLPHNGCSPPPFNEKISTFRVKILEGYVWVHPTPLPPGTEVEPIVIGAGQFSEVE